MIDYLFTTKNGLLKRYLDKWKRRLRKKEYDIVIVVCGREGRGKTYLTMLLGDYMSNGKLTMDNYCYKPEEFRDRLVSCKKKGEVIIWDEAGVGLFGREAMSKSNKEIIKRLMVSRVSEACIILCIPSIYEIDNYVKMSRLETLFYIPRRGTFLVWSHGRAKLLISVNRQHRTMRGVSPFDYGGTKKDIPERLRELWPKIQKKEKAFKMEYLMTDEKKERKHKHVYYYLKTKKLWRCRTCPHETKEAPFPL